VVVAYEKITKSTQITEPTTMHKIDQIVQTIDQYRKEIKNLWEKFIPTTPPEVKEKGSKKQSYRWMKWNDKSTQLSTCLIEKHNYGKIWRKINKPRTRTRKRKR
jgi:hypothetical protein